MTKNKRIQNYIEVVNNLVQNNSRFIRFIASTIKMHS